MQRPAEGQTSWQIVSPALVGATLDGALNSRFFVTPAPRGHLQGHRSVSKSFFYVRLALCALEAILSSGSAACCVRCAEQQSDAVSLRWLDACKIIIGIQ